MIELTFGESSAGLLLYAGLGRGDAEVLALTLALDIGSIRGAEDDLSVRDRTLASLFRLFPEVAEQISAGNRKAVGRLREAFAGGEPVRAWLSSCDPAEVCGFLFLCKLAGQAEFPLAAVDVCGAEGADGRRILSVGEVSPEQLPELCGKEHSVDLQTRLRCAARWQELAAENASVRAFVNGRILGVPTDFYDFALRKFLPEGEFVVAQVLGKALALLPGVGDQWLWQRLLTMCERGELEIVRLPEKDHPYSGTMKKK